MKQARKGRKGSKAAAAGAEKVPATRMSKPGKSKPGKSKPGKPTPNAGKGKDKPGQSRAAALVGAAEAGKDKLAGLVPNHPLEHARKDKLVRDSFTLPREDFDLIDVLKDRALDFKRPTKKSELLRAGLQLLAGLDQAALRAALDALRPLKAGRPRNKP